MRSKPSATGPPLLSGVLCLQTAPFLSCVAAGRAGELRAQVLHRPQARGKHLITRTRWGSFAKPSTCGKKRTLLLSERAGRHGSARHKRCSFLSTLHPMGAGEVITLQFGGFANFVGAHYWNIQARLYTVGTMWYYTRTRSAPAPNTEVHPLACSMCLPDGRLTWAVQDELAGLAEQDAHHGIADQVDSNVLFRQGEDARVSERAAPRCYQRAGSTADTLAGNRGTWRSRRASCSLTAPAPWAVRCTSQALVCAVYHAQLLHGGAGPAVTPVPARLTQHACSALLLEKDTVFVG